MLKMGSILFFWAASDGKESADETVSLSNDSGPSSFWMEAWITSAACLESSKLIVLISYSFSIPFLQIWALRNVIEGVTFDWSDQVTAPRSMVTFVSYIETDGNMSHMNLEKTRFQ